MIFTTKQELNSKLESLNTEADTSYALVFVGNKITDESTNTIRQAVHLCDRVIVASDTLKGTKVEAKGLKALGVDAVYLPDTKTNICKLTSNLKKIDETFVLQSILLVLPNLIVLERSNFTLARCLTNLKQTFGELFAVKVV